MQHLRSLWLSIGLMLTFTLFLSAQSEFKYSYMPKKVYENQLFAITVIGIGEDGSITPRFTFDSSSKRQPLSTEPLVVKNGNDSFYTFYFKADKSDIRIPQLIINTQYDEIALSSRNIFIKTLKLRDDFCGVLAADMKIKNSQVSNYDETNHIVTLSIEAFEANMEDMTLANVVESGVETLQRENAKVSTEFYFVVPTEKKLVKFTYFNTIKKQYVFLEVPVVVEDASVVTQSDLNPKEDNFMKLKKYGLMTFSIFFILMFLFKRDFFYLVFGVISIIILLTLYIPHKKICIKQGASLYILPTSTSTVSTRIDERLDTALLSERAEYTKIEYKEGIIGWIKNEDLCNN